MLRNNSKNSNFFYDLQSREYIASFANKNYRDNRQYPLHYVRSISPMMELIGHNGCVNRLDWNENGDLLASGSDDTTVKIWKPFDYYYNNHHNKNKNVDNEHKNRNKLVCNIQTDHIHNLFGVRFIPGTSDRFLCTGSMDKLVQIQSVDRQRTIKNYQIHTDRVKDVQITPRQPFIFYSVSEDGTIRRFDIRCEYKQFISNNKQFIANSKKNIKTLFRKAKKHINNLNNHRNKQQNGNILIKLDSSNVCSNDSDTNNPHHRIKHEDLFGLNDYMERCMLKGLSINPIRDYEFAIASGDEYVRIFDIRKGNKLTWKQCMSWVVPPHFKYIKNNHNHNSNHTHIHTTFVEYSSDGSQIVVTYHGENVYVFNTKNYDHSYPLQKYLRRNGQTERNSAINIENYLHFKGKASYTNCHIVREEGKEEKEEKEMVNNNLILCTSVDNYKRCGNNCFNTKDYSSAIEYYHKAVNCVPISNTCLNGSGLPLHSLYCNLAMCLYHRQYFNDLLLAIFYCDKAITVKPNYVKAYFWKIKLSTKINDDKLTLSTAKKAFKLFPNNAGISREYLKITKKMNKINHMTRNAKDDDNKQETERVFISKKEKEKQYEFYQRYTGHCNLKTDIKEATFFGDRYICSGSDDGRCFIWDKISGKLVNILCNVDEEVVNTVRRHPHFPILAMSGIDSTIKIWQPSCVAADKYTNSHKIPFINMSSDINKPEQNEYDNQMDQTKMNQVIQENQENLSQPPSQQIDLSTLLFWANLMNQ